MGEDSRVNSKGFEPDKGTYKKSAESVGQLYPVIKDEFGIVDGFHRKDDDPDWREEQVKSGSLKAHYKKMLHANFQRRIVPEDQMKEWINGIAEEMIKEGKELPLGQIINEELGGVIAYNTLMKYLDEKYKRSYPKDRYSPQGEIVTEVAKKEAEKEIKTELKTSKDYEQAAKALKRKSKKLFTPEEKQKKKEEDKERKRKSREKKLEQEKKLKEKLIKEAKEKAKKEFIDNPPEELEEKLKEKIKKELKEEDKEEETEEEKPIKLPKSKFEEEIKQHKIHEIVNSLSNKEKEELIGKVNDVVDKFEILFDKYPLFKGLLEEEYKGTRHILLGIKFHKNLGR